MIALKHEPERFAAQPGEFVAAQRGDVFSGEQVFTRGRTVQTTEDVHQCRLAGPGSADDRHELTGMNRQIDAAQHVDQWAVASAVGFADASQVDQRRAHSAPAADGGGHQQAFTFIQAVDYLHAQTVADAGAHLTVLHLAIGR